MVVHDSGSLPASKILHRVSESLPEPYGNILKKGDRAARAKEQIHALHVVAFGPHPWPVGLSE